jgi:uncharacterized membrane protein YfcA
MSGLEAIALLAVALVAGAINGVAGGGSLLTFPALLAAGYSSKTANVTNTVALWPAYVGASLGYREELRGQGQRLVQLLIPNLAGGLVGAVILLATPETAFDVIVPFLIVLACLMMAAQDWVGQYTAQHRASFAESGRVPWPVLPSMFLLGVYGAYFGAALGLMTLAVFAVMLSDNLQRLNALKGVSSMVINIVAVVWFAVFGPVQWAPAAVMAVGGTIGGYAGVGVARRLGPGTLRVVVVSYGLIVAAVLFARLLV